MPPKKETIYLIQLNREWLGTLITLFDKVTGLSADEAKKYATLYQAMTQGTITDDEYQKRVIEQHEMTKPAPAKEATPVQEVKDTTVQ